MKQLTKLSYKQENVTKVGDFAMVKRGAEKLFGFKEGETVYVAGSFWDQSTTNPYNYRMLLIVGRVHDDHFVINEDGSGGHLMDGKFLRKIKGKRAEHLKATLEADFKPPVPEEVVETVGG